MRLKLLNSKIYSVIFFGCYIFSSSGCMPPGSVVNHERFETVLKTMKLEEYPSLKVYYGGSLREIPLKNVSVITIDPSDKIQYQNELFYSAEISLKDGSVIFSTEKDNSTKKKAFISIHNTISGKNGKELFKINLGNVARLEIR